MWGKQAAPSCRNRGHQQVVSRWASYTDPEMLLRGSCGRMKRLASQMQRPIREPPASPLCAGSVTAPGCQGPWMTACSPSRPVLGQPGTALYAARVLPSLTGELARAAAKVGATRCRSVRGNLLVAARDSCGAD